MLLQILSDNWFIRPLGTFRQGQYNPDEDGWLPATVPAHWQQHPHLERHAGNVVYLCRFSTPTPPPPDDANQQTLAHPQARQWLRLNGTFYWAQPYLNGVDLGRHEGYFEPYEREITALLKPDNTLFIEVECPDEPDRYSKRLITGVFSHWDCIDIHSNPGGLWLPVELHHSGPVRLKSVRCHTESFTEHFAQLRCAVEMDAVCNGPVLLRWIITPQTFQGEPQVIEQQRTIQHGVHVIEGLLKLREPRLWWTHDQGTPHLYTISLEVVYDGALSDRYRFEMGVRQFELRNWIPHLNGQRFLIKGNNYPPGDMRIATMTPERYQHDMHLVQECNMNFLRVHAHVEHPAFYHAANAAGILLWQDMPLQWLYHARVLPEARRQVQAMIHLLYNHPAIAIWCMHNEPLYFADIHDKRFLPRFRSYQSVFGFSWNREVMDRQLKRVAERQDPQRPVIRSSGEFNIPRVRPGTDTHLYFGWYPAYGSLQEFERLRTYTPDNLRFVTEFGAQSFPNVESCSRFLPADVSQLDAHKLEENHSFQPTIMELWLDWSEAQSLHELVDMTQSYQANLNRFYIDRLRYLKYRPTGGIVPFLFCDPYPAILWSIVDYWRTPKRSYHAMRMAFSPQYAFTLLAPRTFRIAEPIDIPLYVVNDAPHEVRGAHLCARLYDPGKAELVVIERNLVLPADCMTQEVDRLRLIPSEVGRYLLEIELTGVSQDVRHTYELDVEK
jgi:beta-mannosidase